MFQDEPQFHIEAVRRYIERGVTHPQRYIVAKELVGRCMPKLHMDLVSSALSGSSELSRPSMASSNRDLWIGEYWV